MNKRETRERGIEREIVIEKERGIERVGENTGNLSLHSHGQSHPIF